MRSTFEFSELADADLVVDATYRGGVQGHAGDDPIARLLPGCGNQGGFRAAQGPDGSIAYAVIFTSLGHTDWPDSIDAEAGTFLYYGDNRTPGEALHDTPRGGNRLLRDAFADAHGDLAGRSRVPPFLLFVGTGNGRDVRFAGLAAPGSPEIDAVDDLVAVWRSANGKRFQNLL